ncbi:uncharacterized protein LOC110627400 [Manihot esculenta]|uniref:Uncharacterized protein n=3 Tax=Manihot esculenta TaxID=3983 RepID=A0A2C9UXR5_MANES|nr:uncharacterized protein LOC110627400 [Manihot esculenta]OAY35835.1 hypothetical protein MANES_12G134500v8 [Manihot esculenta]
MAANAISFDQEIPAVVDGNCDLPVAGSCFQFVKPSFDEVNQQCTLDVLPLLFEETSFPMEEKCAFQTTHGQDVYSISMVSEEDKTDPNCTSQLAFLSFVELPVSPKKQMCLDTQLNCQNFIGFQMESADAYSPCIVDIDIEMENFEKNKSSNEAVGSIKSEGLLTGVLQRQASLKTCGRIMQLFTNHGSTLLKLLSKEKSFNERVYDTPNNRWRKCKRAASFDSRKVVLLFSILSSLGTLILIYLTLKVRQTADGFVNV